MSMDNYLLELNQISRKSFRPQREEAGILLQVISPSGPLLWADLLMSLQCWLGVGWTRAYIPSDSN